MAQEEQPSQYNKHLYTHEQYMGSQGWSKICSMHTNGISIPRRNTLPYAQVLKQHLSVTLALWNYIGLLLKLEVIDNPFHAMTQVLTESKLNMPLSRGQ